MKAAKAWFVAGFGVLAALSSASCGKEEAHGDGSAGKGSVLPSGGGGNGGGSGGGRTVGGGAGTAGSNSTTPTTKLGRACVTDRECEDSAAPGLTCLTSSDTALGGGAPPKGLCTMQCTTNDECAELGPGAVCLGFAENEPGYCFEGCTFGKPELGQQKCHNRPEFTCGPVLGATTTMCTDSTDCQSDEVCNDGVCRVLVPLCLPGCRGDIDCDDGMYCDQSFLNGVCLTKKPAGKPLGAACKVPDVGEPEECLGFCQPDASGSAQGHCTTTCGVGRECGWNSDKKTFDGLCLYVSSLTGDVDTGDFGYCTGVCNCSAECPVSGRECELFDQPLPTDVFSAPGVCLDPDPSLQPYNKCSDMGVGGDSGSAGAAGSDAGGASGAGGAP